MYSQARLENLPPSSLLLPTFSHFPPRWTSTAGSLLLSAYSLNAANSMILFEGDFEILRSLISWWENIGVGWGGEGRGQSGATHGTSGLGQDLGEVRSLNPRPPPAAELPPAHPTPLTAVQECAGPTAIPAFAG